MNSEKQAYIDKIEAQMQEWQAKVKELEAKARQSEADARAGYEKKLREANTKMGALQDVLSDLRSAGEDKVDELKKRANEAIDDFAKTLKSN